MKKLMAVSSMLALVSASSGLFAVDIPVGDGGGKFILGMQAEYEFNIVTDTKEEHDNDKNWIEELDADKQGKLTVEASYDGDKYAFGVVGGFRQNRASTDKDREWFLDDAWGKYYLLDKQLWIRGGGMDGLWRIDTDPLNKNYGGDNGPGIQINFAPSSLTGFNVGVAMPVPAPKSRTVVEKEDNGWTWTDTNKNGVIDNGENVYIPPVAEVSRNWGPTYPLVNAVFGLRLNKTIPNLDIGTELDLLGNEDTNGKGDGHEDEREGDFKGMDFHFTAVYTFAPVTLKAAVLTEGIANNVTDALDPMTSVGARLIFDIPNAEGSSLDLGDPWVQFQMLPSNRDKDSKATKDSESFKDMFIDFEWEPSYSITDQLKALLWLGVGYAIWDGLPPVEGSDDDRKDKKDYQLEFAVQPKIEIKFAPNATLSILDKVFFLRKTQEKGLRNEVGLRFACAFE